MLTIKGCVTRIARPLSTVICPGLTPKKQGCWHCEPSGLVKIASRSVVMALEPLDPSVIARMIAMVNSPNRVKVKRTNWLMDAVPGIFSDDQRMLANAQRCREVIALAHAIRDHTVGFKHGACFVQAAHAHRA